MGIYSLHMGASTLEKKTHFSIQQRNASGINVPNIVRCGKRGKKFLQSPPSYSFTQRTGRKSFPFGL